MGNDNWKTKNELSNFKYIIYNIDSGIPVILYN